MSDKLEKLPVLPVWHGGKAWFGVLWMYPCRTRRGGVCVAPLCVYHSVVLARAAAQMHAFGVDHVYALVKIDIAGGCVVEAYIDACGCVIEAPGAVASVVDEVLAGKWWAELVREYLAEWRYQAECERRNPEGN